MGAGGTTVRKHVRTPVHTLGVAFAALLLAVALIAFAGCSEQNSVAARGASNTDAGSGDRLVVLSPAVAVMLRDLGLAVRIVGKHDYDMVLGDSVPAVGHQEALDYEAIIGVDPTEIIIEWGSRPLPPRLVELADSKGWAVRRVNLLTIDDIARTVDDLAIDFGAVSFDTGANEGASKGASGARPEGVPTDLEKVITPLRFRDPASRFGGDLPSATLARAWSVRGEGFASVGRVLLLGSTTPPGALGPGSFHDQILRRIGGTPALEEGAPWMELDAEDILRLDPAAIVLISPRRAGASGETVESGETADPLERLGRVGSLDIEAVRLGRVALIDDELALLPSTSMAGFADRLAEVLGTWRDGAP